MKVLGIESTAHTLGIGVCSNGRVVSNARRVFKPEFKGLIPREAADHHEEVFSAVMQEALDTAKTSMKEIDLVAYSKGPGLGPCLQVASTSAKTLAVGLKIPIIGVNHAFAHVEIAKKETASKDPLVVYLSGGNSQLLVFSDHRWRVLGETMDIGIGNLFDSFARQLGLKWAHGSEVERLAQGGSYVELPYAVKGMSLSFSGLLTAAVKKIPSAKQSDLCYSLMETAFSMTTEAAERALALTKKKTVVACGGVAQNKRLCEMLKLMSEPHEARFAVGPAEYNGDNGAMIAFAGEMLYNRGYTEEIRDARPLQRFRIDEVIV